MTKTSIKKQLETFAKGKIFLNVAETARALGMGKESARNLLCGLDYIASGREKRYLIDDIAQRISMLTIATTALIRKWRAVNLKHT